MVVRIMALAAILCGCAAVQERPPVETVKFPDSKVQFDLVRLPGGRITLAATEKEKAREVDLKPFLIGAREVTWDEFFLCYDYRDHSMSASRTKVDGISRPSQPHEAPNVPMSLEGHPVINIRWHSAMMYCEWLSKATGRKFRLPTEAEWEYACRAGATGNVPEPLGEYAWTKENSDEKTHPVGKKKPNAFGLYDMLGNAWEYCLESYEGAEYDPVIRGGGWDASAKEVGYSNRQAVDDDLSRRDPDKPKSRWWLTDGQSVGFRVVCWADGPDLKEQEAYGAKVAIKDLKPAASSPRYFIRVTGEFQNLGDRTLDEVELTVYFLDDKGKPMYRIGKGLPTAAKVYPALTNGGRSGEPIKPKASRTFVVDVPRPYDEAGPLEEYKEFGAAVTGLKFAKP